MQSKKKEFEYHLQSNVSVHKNGQLEYCNKILLRAPNSKQQKERCILKQAVYRVMMDAEDRRKEGAPAENVSEKEELTKEEGEAVISLMYALLPHDNMMEVLAAFKDLLLNGCASVLGEKFTGPIFEKIDVDEIDSMLAEYIVIFFLQSRMK